MSRFERGRPVSTRESLVTIDAGLAIGTHAFQLIVVNDGETPSKPVKVVVVIERSSDLSRPGPIEPRPILSLTDRESTSPAPRVPGKKKAKGKAKKKTTKKTTKKTKKKTKGTTKRSR